MRGRRLILAIMVVLLLTSACIGETTTEIPETITPTTQTPIQTTMAPQTTVSPTTTLAPVITTIPPSTEPPETLGPVSDYLLKKGIYGLDVSPLEKDGSLDENDKALIDVISSMEIKTSWRETPVPSIIEDGVVDYEELSYVRLRVKVLNEIDPKFVKVVDALNDRNVDNIIKLERAYDNSKELVRKALEATYGTTISNDKLSYLEKALQEDLLDVAYNSEFYGKSIDSEDVDRLDTYKTLFDDSTNFRKMGWDFQRFIMDTEWVKDGIDTNDLIYLAKVPIDFNPSDKIANTDGREVEDYLEIHYKGDVNDGGDDRQLLLDHNIPTKPFLIWPFKCEITYRVSNYFDLDPNPCNGRLIGGKCEAMRDWKGGKKTYNGHDGIDILVPEGTPVIAAAGGIVETVVEKESGRGVYIKINHGNNYVTSYSHLKKEGTLVKVGQKVSRGDIIAFAGNTGDSSEPHLHFELENSHPVDMFRDTTNSNSKSYWINDNDPLCLSEDGTWKSISEK